MSKYLVVINASVPTESKFLSEANGCNKVYSFKGDADEAKKKCNDANHSGYARVILV